jgi:hypothetical protein
MFCLAIHQINIFISLSPRFSFSLFLITEGVRAGFKAAAVACVVSTVPTVSNFSFWRVANKDTVLCIF